MKILVVHNRYQEAGGEDSVFRNEVSALKRAGHLVTEYVQDNKTILDWKNKCYVALNSIFSIKQFNTFKFLLESEQPDVVHVHNYFPIISPSIFYACSKKRIPVVHTLHNFRSICPTAYLSYDNTIIETSIKRSSWWCVRKKVYRDSYIGTFFLTLMVEIHKHIGTWNKVVDAFIVLTEFNRKKFIEAGFPAGKLFLKPNFAIKPKALLSSPYKSKKPFAVFVGRLSNEKGIDFLLNSWQFIDYKLIIVGETKGHEALIASSPENVTFLGNQTKEEVINTMCSARCLIMASNWYECFPMVLAEAFSVSLPAVVPDLGSMSSIVKDGANGLCYKPNNSNSLKIKLSQIFEDQKLYEKLRHGSRASYESDLNEVENIKRLVSIYETVTEAKNCSHE